MANTCIKNRSVFLYSYLAGCKAGHKNQDVRGCFSPAFHVRQGIAPVPAIQVGTGIAPDGFTSSADCSITLTSIIARP
jgi:hypothetical protein